MTVPKSGCTFRSRLSANIEANGDLYRINLLFRILKYAYAILENVYVKINFQFKFGSCVI